jgi:hypothetical protein
MTGPDVTRMVANRTPCARLARIALAKRQCAMHESRPVKKLRTPPKAPTTTRDLNPVELEKITGGTVSPRDPATGLPGKP